MESDKIKIHTKYALHVFTFVAYSVNKQMHFRYAKMVAHGQAL